MVRPRVRHALPVLLTLPLTLAACQSDVPSAPPTTAADPVGATRPLITLAQGDLVAGISALGVYRLTIADGTATLEPANRSAALTGAKFETDLTAAMNGEILTLCPDCFRVTGVAPVDEDEIAVRFVVRHPIPAPDGVSPVGTVRNRNDLVVNNVRLVALADGNTRMFAASGDDSVVVNADLVTNADGYTKVAPVVDVPGTVASNVFPFITMGDGDPANNGYGNFQPGGGDGAGWDDVLNGNPETTLNYPQGFNALAQGGSLTDELHFNLDGGTLGNFATDLVLLASYIGAADGKPTRLTSRYFMPEGAIQQSPHIEVDVTAPGPDAGDSGVLDITAVDFQQFAPVNPDPVNALQTKDYAAVWSDGRMDRAQVTLGEFIGGTNDFYSNPGDQPGAWNRDAIDAAPGRGTYAEPKLLNQGFVNTGALAGTFRGGIKISDSRQGVAILDVAAAVTDPLNPNVFSSITGLKKDLNVFNPASVVAPQELATYQFFTFTIAGGTSGGTGIPVVSGAVGRANPNFPNANYRNGIAVRNTDIYIPYHWQGDDDSALFVVRSADLGQTWGTPVRVPADAIANTNFEGSTSGWSIFTNTDTAGIYPVLVGIDADEDVVLISGRPTDVNSTDWPANANHRAEVLAQGTGRSFSVSAGHDYNLNGRAWIVINRRETDPATVNQVVLYRATDYNGSGTPTVTRETAANNGVLDDGPSGTSSRFDADLITDTSAKVHVIWKDAGDNYLEYRSWDAANMVLSPVENILGARTITGNTQPNISLVAGDPIVTFVGTGTEVISDAETMDRDVWLVRRTGAGWSTPVMVNTDDADLNETDPDLFPVVTGGGLRVGVVYEAANADGKRAIHFAGLLATDFTDIVRQALTPDPSGIIDRLDPKIIGVPGSAFAVWESKGEGIPMQGAIITP